MKINHQKLASLLLAGVIMLCSLSCKKDKKTEEEETPAFTCTTCKTTPDAKAENNTSSKGIYKGVVVGSTGILSLDILNTGTTPNATLVINGITINLTSNAVFVAGQAFNADFTGTNNGQTFSFHFAVEANGNNPAISAPVFPGHTSILVQLIKETSDNQIKCYEGTSEGVKDNGNKQASTLNFVTSAKTNSWFVVAKDNTSSSVTLSTGTFSGTTMTCNCGTTASVVGTITSDEIKGTYKGSDNHGTFLAKRTL
jgi:hypothetical protein